MIGLGLNFILFSQAHSKLLSRMPRECIISPSHVTSDIYYSRGGGKELSKRKITTTRGHPPRKLDLFILFSSPLSPLPFSLFCQVTLCSEALVRGKNLIRKLDEKRSSVKTSSRIARKRIFSSMKIERHVGFMADERSAATVNNRICVHITC